MWAAMAVSMVNKAVYLPKQTCPLIGGLTMRFGKQVTCPTTQQTLSYVEGSLGRQEAKQIAQHVRACDFCGAEAQLLAKHEHANHRERQSLPLISFLRVKAPLQNLSTFPQRHAA